MPLFVGGMHRRVLKVFRKSFELNLCALFITISYRSGSEVWLFKVALLIVFCIGRFNVNCNELVCLFAG